MSEIEEKNEAQRATPLPRRFSGAPAIPQPHGGALRPFQPGESGNSSGRPNAGLSIIEWFNQMSSYSPAQLAAVLKDRSAPSSKIVAARQWINATAGKRGSDSATDRIIEHTAGKALQRVESKAVIAEVVRVEIVGMPKSPEKQAQSELTADAPPKLIEQDQGDDTTSR